MGQTSHCCDAISLQIHPSEDAAPDPGHSYFGVFNLAGRLSRSWVKTWHWCLRLMSYSDCTKILVHPSVFDKIPHTHTISIYLFFQASWKKTQQHKKSFKNTTRPKSGKNRVWYFEWFYPDRHHMGNLRNALWFTYISFDSLCLSCKSTVHLIIQFTTLHT